MCDKNLPQVRFSNKQLNDVRSQIEKEGRMTKTPKCLTCSGGRLVELECVVCHKTKGLEDFAKSQRKVQDTATCYKCMEVQVTRDAIHESTYERLENMFIKTESSKTGWTDYFSSASSTHDTESTIDEWTDTKASDGSRRNNRDGGIDLSERFQKNFSESGAVIDTLIESEYSQARAHTTRANSSAAASSWNTSITPTASRSSSRVPGTPSVSGSARTFNSSIAEHSQAGHSGTGRSGFAKIRARDTVVDPNIWGKNSACPSSYSSSDDDDDDDDNDDGNHDDDDDDDEFFNI